MNLPLDAPSLASSITDNAQEATRTKDTFASKGASVHKWGTYLGIDWLFNAATGVGFSYAAKYTEVGKKYWSGPITSGFTKILKPFIKHPETLKASAGYGNMFMSIIAGGMFTIPPLMILENNHVKKYITKTADSMIYGKDTLENDPRFAEFYKEIENAPKKDFTSGLTSRFVALSPLLALVIIPPSKRAADKIWFNHVENFSEGVATKVLRSSPEKLFKSLPAAEAKARWKFIHENVAMDFGLGIPYAVLHELFYRRFADKKAKAEAEKNEAKIDTKPETPATAVKEKPATQWSEKPANAPRPKTTLATPKSALDFAERPTGKGEVGQAI